MTSQLNGNLHCSTKLILRFGRLQKNDSLKVYVDNFVIGKDFIGKRVSVLLLLLIQLTWRWPYDYLETFGKRSSYRHSHVTCAPPRQLKVSSVVCLPALHFFFT